MELEKELHKQLNSKEKYMKMEMDVNVNVNVTELEPIFSEQSRKCRILLRIHRLNYVHKIQQQQ